MHHWIKLLLRILDLASVLIILMVHQISWWVNIVMLLGNIQVVLPNKASLIIINNVLAFFNHAILAVLFLQLPNSS